MNKEHFAHCYLCHLPKAPKSHLLCLVIHHLPGVIFLLIANVFHRYIPLFLRNSTSSQISSPNVLFFLLSHSTLILIFNPIRKMEVQCVMKISFIYNLVTFIYVLILWHRHSRYKPAIQLEVWLITNIDPILKTHHWYLSGQI